MQPSNMHKYAGRAVVNGTGHHTHCDVVYYTLNRQGVVFRIVNGLVTGCNI